jgi:hypothetical protein
VLERDLLADGLRHRAEHRDPLERLRQVDHLFPDGDHQVVGGPAHDRVDGAT